MSGGLEVSQMEILDLKMRWIVDVRTLDVACKLRRHLRDVLLEE